MKKHYVSERPPTHQGKRWFVNGPGIEPDASPEFDSPDDGKAFLLGLGIDPGMIVIEPF